MPPWRDLAGCLRHQGLLSSTCDWGDEHAVTPAARKKENRQYSGNVGCCSADARLTFLPLAAWSLGFGFDKGIGGVKEVLPHEVKGTSWAAR